MGLALAPSLLMGQVTGPLGWLQARSVHAASGEELELELFDQERLEVAVLDMADPGPELAARLAGSNIGTLRAEVIERTESMDRIVVRLEDPSCVRSGFPVVCGDGYVGVVDLDTPLSRTRPADQVEVVLITGKQSRIGARITGDEGTGSSELVVGGLSPAREVRLDVHNPRDRSRSSGEVEVYEPTELAEGHTHLANGFRLGTLGVDPVLERDPVPGIPPREVLGIRPDLDYSSGLYQVLVLLPPGTPTPRPAARRFGGEGESWAPARFLLRAETSPWRAGRKLAAGSMDGVQEDSAVASRTRFYGRVARVGATTSDVLLPGDRGFRIPLLAMVEHPDGPRPLVMGEVETLGEEEGRLIMRWDATLPYADTDRREATLWTGSGARGVPRGLLLGNCWISPGPGPHELRVELAGSTDELGGLRVRMPEPVPVEEAGP